MNANRLLEQLGVYIRPRFLAPADCERLVRTVEQSEKAPGGVYHEEGSRLDKANRKVSEVSQPTDEARWLRARLNEAREEIAEHFALPLERLEGPTFLTYRPGDFFLPHRDDGDSGAVSGRKVTVVTYLNAPRSPAAAGGGYEGADLTLYGLMDFPGAENHGIAVRPEPGLLAAFVSNTRHGVGELTRGVRYCAVAWFR